jgi:hypothetical protein
LRNIQSRQFKTNDIDKVKRVINDALVQNQISGSMGEKTGQYYFQGKALFNHTFPECRTPSGCKFSLQVSLTQSSDKKFLIVRIPINVSGFKDGSSYFDYRVTDSDFYNALFSSIGKSLFLDAQAIDLKTVH